MESDHGFLALLGNHGDLALAVHDVKVAALWLEDGDWREWRVAPAN
jgi:hypothetical protein